MTPPHRGGGEISTRSCEAGSECRLAGLAGLAGCWAGYYVRYPVGGRRGRLVYPSVPLPLSIIKDGNVQPPAHALPRCQKCILSLFGLGRFRAVQMDLTASPARPRQMAQTAEYGKKIAEWKLLQESRVIAVTTRYTLPTVPGCIAPVSSVRHASFRPKNVGQVAVRQTSSTNLPACCWNLVPVRCLLCQVAKVGRIASSICPFCSLQLDIRHEQHSCPNRARQGQP